MDILISYDAKVVIIDVYYETKVDEKADDAKDNEKAPIYDEDGEYVEEKTKEDEPDEERKTHKIEILVKANIKNEKYDVGPVNDVAMKDDEIYYYEGDVIYKADTLSGKKEALTDMSQIFEYGEKNYKIERVYNIFYDGLNDRVLSYVYATKYDDFKGAYGEGEGLLIEVEEGDVVNNGLGFGTIAILGTDEDNNLWYYDEIAEYNNKDLCLAFYQEDKNGYDYAMRKKMSDMAYTFDITEQNINLYFLTGGGIYKYDYSSFERIRETQFNPIGAKDGGFVIKHTDGRYLFTNLKGKIIDEISPDDIEVNDKKSVKSKIMCKMFVNSEDEIIIYDLDNKCFRIISENE